MWVKMFVGVPHRLFTVSFEMLVIRFQFVVPVINESKATFLFLPKCKHARVFEKQ
jgi:hypothetical protein